MERQFKDSGIDWIGRIPKEWKTEKAKHIFSQRREKGNTDCTLLAATQKNGMYPQHLLEGVVKVANDADMQQFKTVHINDYVISLRSFQGGFEMSLYEGVCSPAYQVFYAPKAINNFFFKYLFKSDAFIQQINAFVLGIREGKNIQYEDFSTMNLPIPSVEEQRRIADYLDKKCGEIDELIEVQEQMIQKLTDYKNSVITEAVTKGLNPNAHLVPSGIDWIGDVPEGWAVVPLKWILRKPLQYGANESGNPFDESLPRYVRITDILNNNLRDDLQKQSLTEEQANGFILEDNDILFARSGGTVGKAFIYKSIYGRCAFAGYLIRAQINKHNESKFIYYYTQSSSYDEWKKQIFIQATIQNIGADRYSTLEIPIPPLSEQQHIASYLEGKCAEIDSLIALKQQKIEKLKEYKKSVIYEAVTGKRVIA